MMDGFYSFVGSYFIQLFGSLHMPLEPIVNRLSLSLSLPVECFELNYLVFLSLALQISLQCDWCYECFVAVPTLFLLMF